ncbi:MAG TPA: hypothetical protein VJT82_01755 [Pyrinomonadaceae bacterium]|nr:hypothetical protein [Pyrinomonadaceae bacterium]
MTDKKPKTRPLKLDDYKMLIDLYKFYLEIIVKVNVFFFAVAGTILTVVSRATDAGQGTEVSARTLITPVKKIFLVTPFLMSIIMLAGFGVATYMWWELARYINRRAKQDREVELQHIVPFFTHSLTGLLGLLTILFVFVMLWLGDVMRWNHIWF